MPAPLASAVLERAVELPAPPSFDGDRKKDEPSPVAASSKGKGSSGEVKVPKWLKLGPSAFRSVLPSCPAFVTFSRREVNPLHPDGIIAFLSIGAREAGCVVVVVVSASDTSHIVDTPGQRLSPKYTCSLPSGRASDQ